MSHPSTERTNQNASYEEDEDEVVVGEQEEEEDGSRDNNNVLPVQLFPFLLLHAPRHNKITTTSTNKMSTDEYAQLSDDDDTAPAVSFKTLVGNEGEEVDSHFTSKTM